MRGDQDQDVSVLFTLKTNGDPAKLAGSVRREVELQFGPLLDGEVWFTTHGDPAWHAAEVTRRGSSG